MGAASRLLPVGAAERAAVAAQVVEALVGDPALDLDHNILLGAELTVM